VGHIVELRFKYAEKDLALLDGLLRSAPYFSRYDGLHRLYEFRGPESRLDEPTPDCSVMVEDYGLLLNALGDYRVYDAVEENLVRVVEERIGPTAKR